MKTKNGWKLKAIAGLLCLGAEGALAGNMAVTWNDAAGDPGPVGDAISVQLLFDSAGSWTTKWYADPVHPFTGNARFNLNLFDTALGDVVAARTSQVNLDGFHDFGAATATFYSYSGTTPFLSRWEVGHQVSTGNNTNFISGVVNLNAPYGRDNLVTVGTITAAVPEPETYTLVMAGLALLGTVAVRRRQKKEA